MNQYSFIFVMAVAIGVSGCASIQQATHGTPEKGQSDPVVVELPRNPSQSRYELPYGMSAVEALANENVIVYPVDEPLDVQKREFPEYRGVMENTTAGGYTVFDPSVTVFAVEGDAVVRPTYLPEYSVPKYAEQYQNRQIEPAYSTASTRAYPLIPMGTSAREGIEAEPLDGNLVPRGPRLLSQPGKVSRPWMDTGNDAGYVNASRSQEPPARRSRPMLTGY